MADKFTIVKHWIDQCRRENNLSKTHYISRSYLLYWLAQKEVERKERQKDQLRKSEKRSFEELYQQTPTFHFMNGNAESSSGRMIPIAPGEKDIEEWKKMLENIAKSVFGETVLEHSINIPVSGYSSHKQFRSDKDRY